MRVECVFATSKYRRKEISSRLRNVQGRLLQIAVGRGTKVSVTDKWVMNAAARLVSDTKKYDRGLTHLLHSEVHWLDVADRVTYKLGLMVYKCVRGQAPDYLSELCTPVAQVAERHLRSASHLLVVPKFQLDTYGRRTFAVAGPTTCNLFHDNFA